MNKEIIGKKEYISFPNLHLFNLTCKIDTGACTSALHCQDIVVKDGGFVEFLPLDENYNDFCENKKITLPIHKQKYVKSSNGKREFRCYIKTKAIFFGKEETITLSLTNRASMKYPVLIGRKFLKDKFIVDVSNEFLGKKEL